MKSLKMHCLHCGGYYEFKKPTKRAILDLAINFLVCPHCNTPKNKTLHAMLVGDWRCIDCGIGAPFAKYKAKGMCDHCYRSDYFKKVRK